MALPLQSPVDPAPVLTKALLRAGERLGLRAADLARVPGVSAASLSRLGRTRQIEPASKEGELAILLVRLYRSLDALVGGSDTKARAWLRAEHRALGARPIDLIERAEGLVHVVDHLDAMRGR